MPTLTSHSGKIIDLRLPQAGDETTLYTYAQELQAEDTFVLLNPAEPVTWAEEINYLKSTLDKLRAGWQIHYLAFHQGKMIGSSQVTKPGRRKMHLGNLGISLLKDYRHDGIGEQLARLVIDEAKNKLGLTAITLEVFNNNTVAQHLYQKLGFTEYGRLPRGMLYKDGFTDAILMYKPV
jgi:ribosomal protein S18 acetylase RimI-like enzyme